MKKKHAELTIEAAKNKTRKQITAVLVIGMILLLADFIMSSQDALTVEKSYGQLYIARPEAGESSGHLSMKATIDGKSQSYEKKINVTLAPYEKETEQEKEKAEEADVMTMTEEERLEYELRTVVDSLNSDHSVKKVLLPVSLATGESISWEIEDEQDSNTLMILILMIVMVFALYKNRFAAIRKRQLNDQESVLRQLPEFVNRLVLLLNAGLVLNSAFEKSVEESLAFNRSKQDYFHGKLREIYLSMKTANGSMNHEFRRFARESGVKELLRISNILNDNINKGVELTHKLQSESELLWLSRKKRCEEKGRLAETKLTLPLMIFLLVLIVITVAPALLEL